MPRKTVTGYLVGAGLISEPAFAAAFSLPRFITPLFAHGITCFTLRKAKG